MSKGNAIRILGPSADTGFKDEDGGDDTGLSQVIVDFAVNGYCVTYFYEDGTDLKQIYENFDDMMNDIRAKH